MGSNQFENDLPHDQMHRTGKVDVHPFTKDPTKAWDSLKANQIVKSVEPLDPSTEISEDKIRFVCLSDTHSEIEGRLDFVPQGDVLLHGGDFSETGNPKCIHNFNAFLGSLPHKVKIVIAGNHDLSLSESFVNERKSNLQNCFNAKNEHFERSLNKFKVKGTRDLLTNCIYLEDSGIDVCGIKVYGSPWQPEYGGWAFNLDRGYPCLEKWDLIPEETDVLLTHGPPVGHGDLCRGGHRAGCVELLTTVQTRVKPKFHVFGHIHEAYGITTDDQTVFINVSNCSYTNQLTQPAIVFDFIIPDGHSKAELQNIPVNNLTA